MTVKSANPVIDYMKRTQGGMFSFVILIENKFLYAPTKFLWKYHFICAKCAIKLLVQRKQTQPKKLGSHNQNTEQMVRHPGLSSCPAVTLFSTSFFHPFSSPEAHASFGQHQELRPLGWPEVAIPGADQKKRGHWRRECLLLNFM